MHQHSDLPVHRHFEAARIDDETWGAIPTSGDPLMRQLGIELVYERCLNRLNLHINQLVTTYLTDVVTLSSTTPATTIDALTVPSETPAPAQLQSNHALPDRTTKVVANIFLELLQALSQVLPGHRLAVLQPITTDHQRDCPSPQATDSTSDPILQISHLVAPSTTASRKKISCTLPSGQVVRLQHGETFTRDTLQQLRTQTSQSIWPLGRDDDPVGWLLIHPSINPTTDETCNLSLPLLMPQLIERSIHQCMVAIRQIHLIQNQYQYQQSLIAQTEELQQTNQLKSEFLANTSHEIRTPLSSILGFTHLLQVQGFSPANLRHQEYLNIILTSGQHLLALINDILDLSKIEANQLDLQQETIDVPNLCQMAITLVREKATDKGLKLHLVIAPEVSTLTADPLRLKQMLFNLLSNAIKFTLQGSVGLEVTTQGDWLQFCVWDTGTGISREQQRLLFRPYSQIANSAVGQDTGTGLGLALTQKLAELHGGSIKVLSEVDQGSRFTISLPRPHAPNDSDRALPPPLGIPTPPARTKSAASKTKLPSGNSQTRRSSRRQQKPIPTKPIPLTHTNHQPPLTNRILLVEDNIHNAKLILTFLSKLSYEVTWVQDGREMWQALDRSQPALILMDVHLPGEDGLSLTRQIRRDNRYQSIPIIAQTALAMKGDRDLCLEAGAIDYISKPIDLDVLAKLVATYVSRPAS